MRLLALATSLALSGCVPILLPIPVVAPEASGRALPLPVTPPSEPEFDRLLAAFRAENNLPPLTSHAPLDAVSVGHTADMVARNYFSHQSPEGTGPDDRVRAAGIATCGTSELLASGYDDPAKAFAGWKASPLQRAVLEDASMRSYGIGQSRDKWSIVMVRACPGG